MNLAGQSAFLKALGWALLNSLWQFGLLWLIFILLVSTRKGISPALKHGSALLLMSCGFGWFAFSLCYQYFYFSEGPGDSAVYVINNNSVYSAAYINVKKFLDNNLSYLSCGYLVIVGALFIRFSRFFYDSYKIQTKGLSKLRAELRLIVQQLAEQLDIRRKVQVWVSEHIDTPMIIGFLKPTILIPLASISQLSVKQLEAILLHELAHIKRNDYLINLYVASIEILFFFNPFARLFLRAIRQERENCCDDWVVQFRFDPYQYASALLALEQSRSASFSLAVSSNGGNRKSLLQRVQRIMKVKKADSRNGFQFFAYVLSASLLGVVAFVNPGDVVMKNLSHNYASQNINKYLSKASKENNHYLVNPPPLVMEKINQQDQVAVRKEKHIEHISPEINSDDHDPFAVLVSKATNDWNENASDLIPAINAEERDFSIPEQMHPDVPAAATMGNAPFVPSSSFSYFIIDDTTAPKVKIESYHEQVARESLIQAQKAIEKLDWNKIEKELKQVGKPDLRKLKKEIQHSLEQLNWQQINQEVKEATNKECIENMKAALKAEYEQMDQYKTQVREFNKIKNQLQQQQQRYKKEAETNLMEIQKQIGKIRVIVHI